jgi:hypothetical protein
MANRLKVSRALVAGATIAAALAACGAAGLPARAAAQTDEVIRAAVAAAGESKDHPGAGFVAVLERTDVTVEETGLAHYRRHTVTKILTASGALDRAALRFDYDPASNFIEVEGVRIFRAGGAVETVDAAALLDLFQPASAIYWGARMKLLQLPRLSPGDAVEVRTYKKGFEIAYLGDVEAGGGSGTGGAAGAGASAPGAEADVDDERYIPPMRGHFYDVVHFQETYPIREKRYDLHLPPGKPIQYRVYNGSLYSAQSFDERGTHYSWWIYDSPALKQEPRSSDASDVVPKLVLATLSSWHEKSRWFAAIHDTIYTDNEPIRRLVKDLTAGLKTDVEKVAALQHWAAQEIRYSGISMGKGEGYTHHPGTMSYADRCGVCKDKAGMLITLMRTAGYDVWPALTMAGSRVEEVPADQFNHSVVAWRRADGGYTMLDPTWVPYSTELWSSAEQEQHYVIGTPWGEGLMQTPYSPPEHHVLTVTSRGSIDRDGNLAGTFRIEATNYMDQRLRRYLGTHKRDDLRAYVEAWISAVAPNVEVTKIAIGDPLDFKKQFACNVEYRAPRYAVADGSTLDFASPGWKLGFTKSTPLLPAWAAIDPEERGLPLFIWHTETFACDESIALPPGMKARDLAKEASGSGDHAAYAMKRSSDGKTIVNAGKILIKRRTIPADAYAAFRAVVKEAGEYATRRIVFER